MESTKSTSQSTTESSPVHNVQRKQDCLTEQSCIEPVRKLCVVVHGSLYLRSTNYHSNLQILGANKQDLSSLQSSQTKFAIRD